MPVLWCHINILTLKFVIFPVEYLFFGATSIFLHYVLNFTRFSALKLCQDNAHQCTLMWHHFIQCHFDVTLICIILISFFGWLGILEFFNFNFNYFIIIESIYIRNKLLNNNTYSDIFITNKIVKYKTRRSCFCEKLY